MAVIRADANTSDNNMLFAAGLLDRGVLVNVNVQVSDDFLADIDVDSLFAVSSKTDNDRTHDGEVRSES